MKDKLIRLAIVLAMLGLVAGCAQMKITRLTSSDTYTEGLRFYRPKPYLLVTIDAEGKLAGQLISLPDRKEEYVVQQRVGIGSSKLSVTLDGGWNLVALGHDLDTKVPEMITALSGALGSAVFSESKQASSVNFKIHLFEIVYDESGAITHLKQVPGPNSPAPGGPDR